MSNVLRYSNKTAVYFLWRSWKRLFFVVKENVNWLPKSENQKWTNVIFIFFKMDGEKSTEPLWKPFEVPLLDENGEQRYNESNEGFVGNKNTYCYFLIYGY